MEFTSTRNFEHALEGIEVVEKSDEKYCAPLLVAPPCPPSISKAGNPVVHVGARVWKVKRVDPIEVRTSLAWSGVCLTFVTPH